MTDTVNTSEASPMHPIPTANTSTNSTSTSLENAPHSTQVAAERNIEAGETLVKYMGKAQRIAVNAQKERVSRRLLLAMRAKKLTIVCQETGIVSLLEVPAIPNFACEFLHPLSILNNARGLASRGREYLRQLDTQTLAGILLTLCAPYELLRFRPFDSGAEKNAILRTAGKDTLIDAVILIENFVHSRNRNFLPKLSLVIDYHNDNLGIELRINSYLRLLAESITKPDTSPYNENAKPHKIGRPVYIRDVEKAERKISFLARQELSRAKKEFEADKKEAKKLIGELYKDGKVDAKGRAVLLQIFTDDALSTIEPEQRALLCMKLAVKEHSAAEALILLVKKDRKILTADISEIDDLVEEAQSKEIEQEILGDSEEIVETAEEDSVNSYENEDMHGSIGQPVEEQEIPAGLTGFALLLWKKKHAAALQERNVSQNFLDVGTSYVPSEEKQALGKDSK